MNVLTTVTILTQEHKLEQCRRHTCMGPHHPPKLGSMVASGINLLRPNILKPIENVPVLFRM